MESYLYHGHYDLVTPDGKITALKKLSETEIEALVIIEQISPAFVGFSIDLENVHFNIKSALAQLGINGVGIAYNLDKTELYAEVSVRLTAIGAIARELIKLLRPGMTIGKLFAADERRCVRNPDYLSRMFGRGDRWGNPLLSLGGMQGSDDLLLEKIDGRTVAYLTLQNGNVTYEPSIYGFLPTLAKALSADLRTRHLLRLHQTWENGAPRCVVKEEILLLKTLPLHIRTVFGRVINSLLSQGYEHTTANILQPDTSHSGDIYELFGDSKRELTDIPLEFYTLEPHREHVFFEDRDQLQTCLDDRKSLFKAFETAPHPENIPASVFVVKGEQLLNLTSKDWIARKPRMQDFPGVSQGTRQALMVDRYIRQQPSYLFLKSIVDGLITSQGVLFCRHFPSPLMKRMFLGDLVQRFLKGLYFQLPSSSYQEFFSHEDRALLQDLIKFGIPVYWVDKITGKVLQYLSKPGKDSGMFVPIDHVESFLKSTAFGIYGSNLLHGLFEEELKKLLQGVLDIKDEMTHPLMNSNTPLMLVTGGGPGAMEVGNRVAKSLNILSCANIVDFRSKDDTVINEQHQNPHIEAKMTYRIDKLVERQAEFHLDFPIFLTGGIGTDFEFALEEVRKKIGIAPPNPILLFGKPEYWREKITSRFKCNLAEGTIKGSEWISNCFFCVETAEEGLSVYKQFFEGTLPIGKNGAIYEDGFVTVAKTRELSRV